MKIEVDLGLCRSYGLCTGIAPDVFELSDDDGVLHLLRDEAAESRRADLEEAALMCPRQAISLIDG